MTLPKQRKDESDTDYAVRLERAREARRKRASEYYEANKEAILEKSRKYNEAKKEAVLEQKREYYRANREAMIERNREYYKVNKEAVLEQVRQYRKTNKEAIRDRKRKYYKANKEAIIERAREYRKTNKEAIRKRERKYYEAKVLAQATGGALNVDFSRAQRPAILTRLILQEAERFCLDYNISLDSRFDTDVLRHASRLIRDSRELNGELNPWYGTDFLCEALISQTNWSTQLRRTLRKWAQA